MKTIEIKKQAVRKYKDGYPRLNTHDFVEYYSGDDGEFIQLVCEKQFIAYAYLAKQRNNDGWIISLKEQSIPEKELFRKFFTMAQIRRKAFYYLENTSAFRFFNGSGDGLGGITIDYYAGYYVFTFDNKGIYYHRNTLYQAFNEAVPDALGIYERLQFNVQKAALKGQHVSGQKAPVKLEVLQAGLKLKVDLNDGFFDSSLDKRNLLEFLLNGAADEKIVLNLFSNDGILSGAAMKGGAFKTVNVDLSSKAMKQAQENLLLNGVDPSKQELRVIDIMSYLDYAQKHHIKFDMVIIDPPVFVRSKKNSFLLTKDYPELISAALKTVKKGGTLVLTANSASLSLKKLKEQVIEIFAEADRQFELRDTLTLTADFVTNKKEHADQGFKGLVVAAK
ncbi:class I SAM-dependent rRNA methyltransferase [Liquorilactobacillus oeni]|uniref:AdoMet-dependent methyltransferase n=1 Tax=Liquorilactobacillus oeni DSM 19972 TaxID=1423777 RepID=A0A0R1M6Q7_9LACO|nr:class I SAM-dependent rRNA methyltransferase [Liquorilactobacillus oeni]KRL03949.1 AdoMet-dependent methyltransferase [Liquorilactobacillus oeni DSM 19972]